MPLLDQNSGYGQAQMASLYNQCGAFGAVHVVFNSADSANPNYNLWQYLATTDSYGIVRFHTTLLDAYNACTSNNNDVILLDANSSHTVTGGIAWTKNRIHVIGMDGGHRLFDQGSKVEQAGTDAAASVITITGTRNTFRNIKFIQSSTAATALAVVTDGGEGTVYQNCSFIFSVVNNLGGTTAHEFVGGNDSATFLDCTFGADTLLTSAARSVFYIKAVAGGAANFKTNYFENCRFLISSSSSTALFIQAATATTILFTNEFKNTTFIASVDSAGGAALAEAVFTGTGSIDGTLNFTGTTSAMNVGHFATATSGGNSGVQIASVANTALLGGVGVTPVAA